MGKEKREGGERRRERREEMGKEKREGGERRRGGEERRREEERRRGEKEREGERGERGGERGERGEERRRLLSQHPGYLLVRVLTFDLHLVEEAAVKNLVVIVGDTHIAHLCMHLQVPTSIVATNSILPPPPPSVPDNVPY